METITAFQVGTSDLDQLNHMNYKKYIEYFEEGRNEWFRQSGMSLDDIHARNWGMAMKKMEVLYLKEVVLGESLHIVTSPKRLGNTSFTLKQVLFNREEQPMAETEATMVLFDLTARKAVKVPEAFARYF